MRFSRILKFVTRNRNFGINMPRNLFPHSKSKSRINDQENNNKKLSAKSRKVRPSLTINTIDVAPQYAWAD